MRIDDLDRPREMRGAADQILKTLEAFGFTWDGPVVRQSLHTNSYRAALRSLSSRGLTYNCRCTRAQLEDGRYAGTCRERGYPETDAAIRLKVGAETVRFTDGIQGPYAQEVRGAVGDPLLRRRDQLPTYLLAVVVDDETQGVTHIVRGADLLDSTPRQIYLQRLLCLAEPRYAHVPLLTEASGGKLAKSRRSLALDAQAVIPQLVSVFALLGMPALQEHFAHVEDAWRWAEAAWNLNKVPKRMKLTITS